MKRREDGAPNLSVDHEPIVCMQLGTKLEETMATAEPLKIVGTGCSKAHNLIVEYSDGTTAIYLVEQRLDLEPQQTFPADSQLTGLE
jgi:hypothetical protein